MTVTTPGGSSAATAVDHFTYYTVPIVSAVTPNQGPTAGGTTVVLTGTFLAGATAVDVGPTSAVFTVNSATQVTITTPSRAAIFLK